MICGDPDRLADFYEAAFGFAQTGEAFDQPSRPSRSSSACQMRRPASLRCSLANRRSILPAFSRQASPIRAQSPDASPLFQHCAIVVSDMAAAYARLSAQAGWEYDLDRWAAIAARFIGRRHRI